MSRFGKRPRQQFAGFGRRDDLHGAVGHALREPGIERHEFGVDIHRVGVHRREQSRVTGKGKITVLQRLVDAYAEGTHVNTKKLMEDTNCGSPANLFSKNSPWRDYLMKVKGAHAWQLNLPTLDEPVEDPDASEDAAELVEST